MSQCESFLFNYNKYIRYVTIKNTTFKAVFFLFIGIFVFLFNYMLTMVFISVIIMAHTN